MKRNQFTTVLTAGFLVLLAVAGRAIGSETDLPAMIGLSLQEQHLFWQTFFAEIAVANQSSNAVSELKRLYTKYTNIAEQAEIELTIARIFNQRTGLVNPTE